MVIEQNWSLHFNKLGMPHSSSHALLSDIFFGFPRLVKFNVPSRSSIVFWSGTTDLSPVNGESVDIKQFKHRRQKDVKQCPN